MFKVSECDFALLPMSCTTYQYKNICAYFGDQIVAVVLCLAVLTANAIPAPQLVQAIERAFERGVENAAERVFEREGGFGGSRGFDGDDYGGGYGPGSGYQRGGNYYG